MNRGSESRTIRVTQKAPVISGNTPGRTSPVAIPFKLYQDHLIVVQGALGDLEQLNFLIDTGSNPSAIDRKIAAKFGLRGTAAKLLLFNRSKNVDYAILPSMRIGPIRAVSVPGLVQDLSPVGDAMGLRIDAVVGIDVLSRSSFSIDYESKRMVFGAIELSQLS